MTSLPRDRSPAICANTPFQTRIPAIDVLRGLLAWLVVLWHCCQFTGNSEISRFLSAYAMDGHEAVLCFFIISGFSIVWSILGDGDGFSLKHYFIKRWLRIYPAYVIALAATFALSWLLQESFDPGIADWRLLRTPDHPALHWIVHLVMGQGLLPDSILPGNQYSILPAAWSLSLEEQFYLAMPLAMIPFLNRKYLLHCAVMLLGVLALKALQAVAGIQMQGTLAPFAHYFLLGICSAFALHPAVSSPVKRAYLASFILLFIAIHAGRWHGWRVNKPAAAWLLVCGLTVLPPLMPARLARLPLAFVKNPALLWMGKCSYSTYLFHMPALMVTLVFLGKRVHGPEARTFFWISTGICAAGTLLLASASYLFVESPLIRYGRSLGLPRSWKNA